MKKLQPYAKAFAPAILGAVAALLNAVAAGSFNGTSAKAIGLGLVSAVVAYFVPNKSAAKAPAK